MVDKNVINVKNPIILTSALFFLILMTYFAYYETFAWLYERYTAIDTYYSHGFLIPIISIFFIWQKRNTLKTMQAEGAKVGLIIAVGALGLNLVGIFIHFYFITGISLFLFLIGSIMFIYGKKIVNQIMFPLVFVIFMIPLPLSVINALLFPMKMIVLKSSILIIRAINIPVYVEGFNVHVPNGVLEIGNPCSGLRSMIAFLAMGTIVGYLHCSTGKTKIGAVLTSVPIAFLVNILRTVFLILVAVFIGIRFSSPDYWLHDASGILVFAMGFALLIGIVRKAKW